jgi:hypothetical protein
MVVFTRQKLISDPPFSRMDLISCCNLLIYFELSLQKMIMPVFHYALKPVGYLLLGASESIGEFTDLFEAVDKRYKIYVKKVASSVPIHLPLLHKEYGERSLPALLVVRGEAAESLRGELNTRQPMPKRRLPRDYLQSIQEQHEAANKEAQSTNEEMANRNAELNSISNDLVNLQNSAQIAIVLLGRDLAIRRFTTQAEKEFGLLATDFGRPIGHVRQPDAGLRGRGSRSDQSGASR